MQSERLWKSNEWEVYSEQGGICRKLTTHKHHLFLSSIQRYARVKIVIIVQSQNHKVQKHGWMRYDQVGPFPFELKVTQTVTIKL